MAAATCTKQEPLIDTEKSFDAPDITEMKWENNETALSVPEEQPPDEVPLTIVPEERPVNSRIVCLVEKALESKQPQTYFRSSTRLLNSGYSVNLIINVTRTLLDDFCLMSQSRKSLYCSKIQFAPLLVKCNECGKRFVGRQDRVLQLSKHIDTKHHKVADKLFLDLIKRYSALLERMRKFLHMDRRLIAACYD